MVCAPHKEINDKNTSIYKDLFSVMLKTVSLLQGYSFELHISKHLAQTPERVIKPLTENVNQLVEFMPKMHEAQV